MADIPHAVLSEQFQEHLKGKRLRSAVFSTYKFDPGFFEKDILPVFLDIPLSDSANIQIAQIASALRSRDIEISVYYDAAGLTGDESARLDISQNPIRLARGIFHTKNVLLLLENEEAENDGYRPRELVVACLSANLTKAGWWENIEVCHIEKIDEWEKSVLKQDIAEFLGDLREKSPPGSDHRALEDIRVFLHSVSTRQHKSYAGRLKSHLYQGRESLVDFLERLVGSSLRGAYLEVISPYFDDSPTCIPLENLIERFQPKEIRVYLPRNARGEAECRQELYQSVQALPQTSWAKLPEEIVRSGGNNNSANRFVHAKVYRFFTQNPKREICLIGSANLTNPGHSGKANMESGFLVDIIPQRRPDFWLAPENHKVSTFKMVAEDEETVGNGRTNLVLRYHWDTSLAEAYWDSPEASPQVHLEGRKVKLGTLDSCPPREWVFLPSDLRMRLAEILLETSFVTVYAPEVPPALVMVQEMGMMAKPSLALKLSVADILLNWSLLTDDERALFVESRVSAISGEQGSSDGGNINETTSSQETFFDKFAGIIHGFANLERAIRRSIDSRHTKDADYRLFGTEYDSLGSLIKRLESGDEKIDDVERYVILSCARQVMRVIAHDYQEYWRNGQASVQALEQQMLVWEQVRLRLIEANGPQFDEFLRWFDRWFVEKAVPILENEK